MKTGTTHILEHLTQLLLKTYISLLAIVYLRYFGHSVHRNLIHGSTCWAYKYDYIKLLFKCSSSPFSILLIKLFFLKLGFVFPTLFFKLIVITGLYKTYSNKLYKKQFSVFEFSKNFWFLVLFYGFGKLDWSGTKKNHLSLADISCPFCSTNNYHFKSSCLESQKESIGSLRLKLQMFVIGAGNQN